MTSKTEKIARALAAAHYVERLQKPESDAHVQKNVDANWQTWIQQADIALDVLAVDEPIAWESTTSCYHKYITEGRFQKLRPAYRKWYKPYRCSACSAPSPEPKAWGEPTHGFGYGDAE